MFFPFFSREQQGILSYPVSHMINNIESCWFSELLIELCWSFSDTTLQENTSADLRLVYLKIWKIQSSSQSLPCFSLQACAHLPLIKHDVTATNFCFEQQFCSYSVTCTILLSERHISLCAKCYLPGVFLFCAETAVLITSFVF